MKSRDLSIAARIRRTLTERRAARLWELALPPRWTHAKNIRVPLGEGFMTCRGGCPEFGGRPEGRLAAQQWLQAFACALLVLTLSAGAPLRAAQPTPNGVHVFLIRGFLNIFSLGMDKIAERLQREGIYATVHNHLAWSMIADEAIEEYKSGKIRKIILVGHSAGVDAISNISARLDEHGIPVKLAIGLDPGLSRTPVSGHIDRYVNYYVSDGIGHPVTAAPDFHGILLNVDVKDLPGVGHFNIEKNEGMEERVLRDIHAVL